MKLVLLRVAAGGDLSGRRLWLKGARLILISIKITAWQLMPGIADHAGS
jgi:hypothetical protein